jgi:hypothetical protein
MVRQPTSAGDDPDSAGAIYALYSGEWPNNGDAQVQQRYNLSWKWDSAYFSVSQLGHCSKRNFAMWLLSAVRR